MPPVQRINALMQEPARLPDLHMGADDGAHELHFGVRPESECLSKYFSFARRAALAGVSDGARLPGSAASARTVRQDPSSPDLPARGTPLPHAADEVQYHRRRDELERLHPSRSRQLGARKRHRSARRRGARDLRPRLRERTLPRCGPDRCRAVRPLPPRRARHVRRSFDARCRSDVEPDVRARGRVRRVRGSHDRHPGGWHAHRGPVR